MSEKELVRHLARLAEMADLKTLKATWVDGWKNWTLETLVQMRSKV